MFDVSVLFITYDQDIERIIKSLDTIISQKDITVQLVISDDSSKETHFDEIRKYLESNLFYNFELITSDTNEGTVKNIKKGLDLCKGRFVKILSPGDYFVRDNILFEWINFMDFNNAQWSFSNVFCYSTNDFGYEFLKIMSHPQFIKSYVKEKDQLSRWNYLVLDDIVNGASTICKADFIKAYIDKLVGRVFYAEDNIYRLMMFEGICGKYFDKETICYEINTGISTQGSSYWSEKLKKDWQETNLIMLEIKHTVFQGIVLSFNRLNDKNNRIVKLFVPGKVFVYIKKKLFPRYTRV